MPLPTDVASYGCEWQKWWKELQPSWRGDSLSQKAPPDVNWSSLSYGGTTGLVLVVLALSWWICARNGVWDDDIALVVDDVKWALGCMRVAIPDKSHGEKRDAEENTREMKAKRFVCMIFCF